LITPKSNDGFIVSSQKPMMNILYTGSVPALSAAAPPYYIVNHDAAFTINTPWGE
jgi:hypothetical protein